MRVRFLSKYAVVELGRLKFRSGVKLSEFPPLFRQFIAFDEGVDWRVEGNVLEVKHPNLSERALLYIALRRAGLRPEEARRIVNMMRAFEASALASVLEYRLFQWGVGFLRDFGAAIASLYRRFL